MSSLFEQTYNPDVLSCLANLSNDEVFTPPDVANQMLDLLPKEIWADPDVKILDPACKSGVFLREAAKRMIDAQLPGYERRVAAINEKKRSGEELSEGDEGYLAYLQQVVDHIFKEQLYGIAITELTSLLSRRSVYCSKYPNSKYSVAQFDADDVEGNIRFKNCEHVWKDGRCAFCGAAQKEFDEAKRNGLETHAYEFIHTAKPEELLKLKWDVVISNPPYQLNDAGNGKSAKPIYHLFVDMAKKLNPRYMTMIIPSRWFSGGKGLDGFRQSMLSDKRIKALVDYENFKDVFPGVDLAGGACYFLWERDYSGPCEVTNMSSDNTATLSRNLDEFDVFIRQNMALGIVRKVLERHPGPKLSERVSARKPFGIPTNYQPAAEGIPCWFIQRIGYKHALPDDVEDPKGYLNKWKLLVPKAPIAGQTDFSKPVGFYYEGNTRIAKPGDCCTESWIVAGAFDTEEEVVSFRSYLFTKTVRFLLLQTVVSQDVTKKNYLFVPDVEDYTCEYTDAMLRERWGITDEEWAYIDSRIGTITGVGNHRSKG